MADEEKPDQDAPPALPGDIVQVTDQAHRFAGALGVVESPRRWGVEVALVAVVDNAVAARPDRLTHAQFVVVGVAHLLSPEVAAARRDALATAREVAAS